MTTADYLRMFLVALLCSACHGMTDGHHHEEGQEEDGGHRHPADAIIMDPDKAEAAGVEVEVVRPGVFHDVIQTSGRVVAASCDENTVASTVTGLVTHVRDMGEGMPVAGGSTLFYVSSAKLQDGDATSRAYLELQTAQKEYERMKPLVEKGIVTERDFSTVRADYEKAKIAYKAVADAVTDRGVAVKSPVTGYIKECLVRDGDYVEVGTPLMVITKNHHLYLRAEVPVRYYSSLGSVRSAKFRTQYSAETFDLADMNGRLLSLGKSAASTTSYVPVTFQFDNKDQIVPGAYAEVFLITDERDTVLSLPQSSLTEEQGLYYVYIKESDHCYLKREVTPGATDGMRTEITSGLQGGENVVVKGAVSVRLAGAGNAIPAHTHNH